MYKPISNYNNPENPSQKSSLCSQVEAGEITTDQLLCCPNDAVNKTGKCVDYSSNCTSSDNRIAKCHNLTNFDACRRTNNQTDVNAVRVCG